MRSPLFLLALCLFPLLPSPARADDAGRCRLRARAALALAAAGVAVAAPVPREKVAAAGPSCPCGADCKCPAGVCPACPTARPPLPAAATPVTPVTPVTIDGARYERGADGVYRPSALRLPALAPCPGPVCLPGR